MYGEVVYKLGKRYSEERERNPETEYPFLSGQISDLVDPVTQAQLPELQGEYVIAYNDGQGTNHLLHVYFEQGAYELEGMPSNSDAFNLSSEVGQFIED